MTLVDDVRRLQNKCTELDKKVDVVEAQGDRLHQQVNGERGIFKALQDMTQEIGSLRKAAYWLAALIVGSSIGFAFSVLVFLA